MADASEPNLEGMTDAEIDAWAEQHRQSFGGAQWVVMTQDDTQYEFRFMPDGTVTLLTEREGQKARRVFTYAAGVWEKENFNG